MLANIKKVYLQVGNNPKKGNKIGVPAQTMFKIFIEIVLNLIATYQDIYLKFIQYKYKSMFRIQIDKILS